MCGIFTDNLLLNFHLKFNLDLFDLGPLQMSKTMFNTVVGEVF